MIIGGVVPVVDIRGVSQDILRMDVDEGAISDR